MSKRSRIAGSLLALVMVLSCVMFGMTSVAFADSYDYTVTVRGGAQGTVNGDTPAHYDLGEEWSAGDYSVKVTNPKYYFKGWHYAGIEAEGDAYVTGFEVTKDIDVVATYGVKGDDVVSYTVTFEDADGNELRAPQTYYGRIGEKPVVSYLYIEGYLPQAYNLTRTLTDNEATNVFPFVYTAVNNGGEGTEEGGEGTEEGGTGTDDGTAGGGAAGGAGAGAGTAGGAAVADGDGAGAGANGDATIDDDTAPQTEPEDTQDLDSIDDEESPEGEAQQPAEEAEKGGLGTGAMVGIGAAIAALIALLIAFFMKKRGTGEDAAE